jgi:hypothetical protein
MTTARRAHKELAPGLFHLVKQCKKVPRAITPDASSQLVAPNGQSLKGRQLYVTEDLEHIPFSGLSSNRTDVPGLSTVIRAPEIGVADIDVSIGSTNRIGEERLYIRGQGNAAKSLCAQTKQKPLGSQVDRQCGDDPVW